MSPDLRPRRNRITYGWLIAATILAGLASRRFSALLPAFLGKYPGDVLWAQMVVFGWALLFPASRSTRIALLSIIVCAAVEVLKLWQTPGWMSVRHSTLGHLVFGQVFSWQNLVAYGVGIAAGLAIDKWVSPRPAAGAARRT